MFYGSFHRYHPGSRILEVDEEAKKAFVHFNGWAAKFDNWIDYAELTPDTQV
jgi:hypothetical protein